MSIINNIMRVPVRIVFAIGILETVILFLLLMSLCTFLLYVVDKRNAIKGRFRISERVLIFFTLFFGAFGAFFGMKMMKHKIRTKKFKIVLMLGFMMVMMPVIHLVHGFTLDKMVRFVEVEFHSERWPAALDGYRIAFMTDFHNISNEINMFRNDILSVVQALEHRNVDMVLLGGDFSTRGDRYQQTLTQIAKGHFGGIHGNDGIFGVEGNHDDYMRLFAQMHAVNIIPLDNSGVPIRPGFYLAGVQDLWNRNPNIDAAISGAQPDDFVLLIAHNPDVVMQQSTTGVDLILSGHTHGGQITFFGWPFYLFRGSITDYGTRFGHGWNTSRDDTPVFTSRGVGPYYDVPRVFSRPEVVILTMYRK